MVAPPTIEEVLRMQETTNQGGGSTSVTDSPVDDATYNLLQALTSKLEAIEAYEMYVEQDEDNIFEELIEDERRHAERLYAALRARIAGR
jgi:rubrerythrin